MKIIVFMLLMVSVCYAGQQYENMLPDANGNPTYYSQESDGSVTTSYQQGGLNDANGNPTRYTTNTGTFNDEED